MFTRYGRVGEIGTTRMINVAGLDAGVEDFKKRFKSKTKNKWCDRDHFVKKKGRYAIIEMDLSEESSSAAVPSAISKTVVNDCTLGPELQTFLGLIFSKDMFKAQMETTFKLDTRKLPLGKLSQKQLDKGMQALIAIESRVRITKAQQHCGFVQSFYTIIPHASNRGQRLPVFTSKDDIQEKKDMLTALADIESALKMQSAANVESVEHPTDIAYRAMGCKLQVLDKTSDEFKKILLYTENTKKIGKVKGWCCGTNVKREILQVFRVDRNGSAERYNEHDALGNRKLLWHGPMWRWWQPFSNPGYALCRIREVGSDAEFILPPKTTNRRHMFGKITNPKPALCFYVKLPWEKKNMFVSFFVKFIYLFFFWLFFLFQFFLFFCKIVSDDSSLRQAPSGYDSVVALGKPNRIQKPIQLWW